MHENRMNTGDFNHLAFFNFLSYFSRLGSILGLNRHQRHQNDPFELQASFAVHSDEAAFGGSSSIN
jgi:hypothetical protein